MSHLQRELELNGRKITLVGTAHVSAESIKEVETTEKELTPDCVAIELDDKRADSIENKDKYRDIKVIEIDIGTIILTSVQFKEARVVS